MKPTAVNIGQEYFGFIPANFGLPFCVFLDVVYYLPQFRLNKDL